jgi:hypothetical protein
MHFSHVFDAVLPSVVAKTSSSLVWITSCLVGVCTSCVLAAFRVVGICPLQPT